MLSIMNEIDPCSLLPLCVLYEVQNQIYQQFQYCLGFNVLVYFPHLQLDVTSTQLFVTDNDFRDEAFRNQLSETVQSLLALKVIPIFNKNYAVSTRRAPYEVCYHF